MELKRVIWCLFNLVLSITSVHCECTLKVDTSPEQRPIFTRTLGPRILRIADDYNSALTMYYGEKITANCSTRFKEIKDVYQRRKYVDRTVDLYCIGREISVGEKNFQLSESEKLSCEEIEWDAFSSNKNFPWCPKYSYILASRNLENIIILGSLCYYERQVVNLRYTTNNFNLTQDLPTVPYPYDIRPELIQTGTLNRVEVMLYSDLLLFANDVLRQTSYRGRSIVQGKMFQNLFKSFADLLQIYWWENLHEANWQRFIQALEERSTIIAYDVYLGISGNMRYPEMIIADKENNGNIKLETNDDKIPEYIWSYVRAVDDSDEFVFISFNSPYFEFFNSTDVIFCKDICSEIPWLSQVRSTFRYSTLGVSFCCTVDAVRNSGILNGFPKEYKSSEWNFGASTEIPSDY